MKLERRCQDCLENNLKSFSIMLAEDGSIDCINSAAAAFLSIGERDCLGRHIDDLEFASLHLRSFDEIKNKLTNHPYFSEECLTEKNCQAVHWTFERVKTRKKNQILCNGVALKQLLSQLQDKTRKLSTLENIIDYVPSYLFWKDSNSVFQGCNKLFAEAALLASPKDIVGKTDYELPWTKAESDSYRADDVAVMKANKPKLNIEESQTTPDGKHTTLLTSKVPLRDEYTNEVIGVLGIYSDITDLKNAQLELKEALEKSELANRAKTEFIANMSHDIRTPLSGIIAMTESIVKSAANIENRKKAYDAYLASKQLEKLLNEILTASRLDMDMGKGENLEPINLKEIIRSVADLFRPAAQQKTIEIKTHYDKKLSPVFIGSHVTLHRLLLNLVGNAIKFTHEGEIIIAAKFMSQKKNNVTLNLSVKDTGIGMAKESQADIFEPFHRLTASYQGNYKGSGLGLYIVKQIMDNLGGKIRVESEVGEGSEFICEFDLMTADETTTRTLSTNLITDEFNTDLLAIKQNMAELKEALVKKYETPRILLVEDDQLSQKIGQMNLIELGCDVDVVSLGADALDLLETEDYDMIFLDVGIPDLSGYEITKEIRHGEEKNNKSRVPIIALTAHLDSEGQQKAKKAGMDQVLFKPMSIELLAQVFQRWLLGNDVKMLAASEKQKRNELPVIEFSLERAEVTKIALIDLYHQLPERKFTIEKHFLECHVEALMRAVHQLHGCACYCGVPRLVQACIDLQNSIHRNGDQFDQAMYRKLLQEMDTIREQAPHYL